MSLITDNLALVAILLLLNWIAHAFLLRFFSWYKKSSLGFTGKTKPISTKSSKLGWVLFIPPVSIVIVIFLVGLGLILQIFDKKRKRNAKNSRSFEQ